MVMILIKTLLVILILVILDCGGSFKGLWKGSGEIFHGNFFELSLNMNDSDNLDFLITTDKKGLIRPKVCKILKKDDEIRLFVENHFDDNSPTCSNPEKILIFNGLRGKDLISGDVKDQGENKKGVFRIFRVK